MGLEEEILKHKTIEELEADIQKLQSMMNVNDQMLYCFIREQKIENVSQNKQDV